MPWSRFGLGVLETVHGGLPFPFLFPRRNPLQFDCGRTAFSPATGQPRQSRAVSALGRGRQTGTGVQSLNWEGGVRGNGLLAATCPLPSPSRSRGAGLNFFFFSFPAFSLRAGTAKLEREGWLRRRDRSGPRCPVVERGDLG